MSKINKIFSIIRFLIFFVLGIVIIYYKLPSYYNVVKKNKPQLVTLKDLLNTKQDTPYLEIYGKLDFSHTLKLEIYDNHTGEVKSNKYLYPLFDDTHESGIYIITATTPVFMEGRYPGKNSFKGLWKNFELNVVFQIINIDEKVNPYKHSDLNLLPKGEISADEIIKFSEKCKIKEKKEGYKPVYSGVYLDIDSVESMVGYHFDNIFFILIGIFFIIIGALILKSSGIVQIFWIQN